MAGLPPAERSLSVTAAWCYGALMEAVWRWFGVPGDPPMTRFLAVQLALSHYFDIAAARRDFGYQPRVSTAEGMRPSSADTSEPACVKRKILSTKNSTS